MRNIALITYVDDTSHLLSGVLQKKGSPKKVRGSVGVIRGHHAYYIASPSSNIVSWTVGMGTTSADGAL